MDAPLLEIFSLSEKRSGDDGVEFCGISEENFSLLETELKNMITAMKATVKEMSK